MTGYTVHTGSTEKFSTGWDNIFPMAKAGKKPAAANPEKSLKSEKLTKKSVVKSVEKAVAKGAKSKTVNLEKKKTVSKSVKRGK